MSEIALFNPAKPPSFVKTAELSDLAKSLAGGAGGNGGKRISTKGGVFRLMVGNKEVTSIDDRHLDVVIVQAAPKIGRTFYAGTYQEGSNAAPDCWSANGDTPDKSIEEPQASSCANCPQNVKGSGQGDSKACRFHQHLAVVLANDLEGDVMQLKLSALSIFGKEDGDKRPLQAYARYLTAQNINPEMLVTRLRFDTKAAVAKLFFQPVRWLSDEEYAICAEKGKSKEAVAAVTMTVSKAEKPLQLEGTKPVAKKEPQVDTETGEIDEPEVRKATAKPNAVPVKKAGKLADLVGEWDTDDE